MSTYLINGCRRLYLDETLSALDEYAANRQLVCRGGERRVDGVKRTEFIDVLAGFIYRRHHVLAENRLADVLLNGDDIVPRLGAPGAIEDQFVTSRELRFHRVVVQPDAEGGRRAVVAYRD